MTLKCPACETEMVFDGEYTAMEMHLDAAVWRFMCPRPGCFREALVSSKMRPLPAVSHRQPNWYEMTIGYRAQPPHRPPVDRVLGVDAVLDEYQLENTRSGYAFALWGALNSLCRELTRNELWADFVRDVVYRGHRVVLESPPPRIEKDQPVVFHLHVRDGGEATP